MSKIRSEAGNKQAEDPDASRKQHPPAFRMLGHHALTSDTAGVILLVSITLLAYLPALRAGYVWDDDVAVRDNELLRTPKGLWEIWSQPSKIPQGHYWPLVYTTFWMEYRAWGLHPFGYHLDNVLLHIVNSILVWRVLRRLAVPGAWLAGAVFALHPVHVESVAWIVERKDVLSGLLYLLAFLTYVRFDDTRKWALYALSLSLFVGAMLSKSMTVSLPVALLLVLWWKRERLRWQRILPLLPFFVIAFTLAVVDMRFAQRLRPVEYDFSLVERCLIASRAICFYVTKLFLPLELMAIYPRWEVAPGALFQWGFPCAIAAVFVFLWFQRRRLGKGPFSAVLYFVVTLGPILGFVDFGFSWHSFVADHFQYLASIGIIVLFASGVTRVAQKLSIWKGWFFRSGSAILLMALAVLTWQQAGTFRDMETLFRYNVAHNPHAKMAHYNLGLTLAQRGKTEEAVQHYVEAINLDPNFADAHNNLGLIFAEQSKLEDAIAHYSEVLRINPNHADAHNNLGNALLALGRTDQAAAHYAEALRINPSLAKAHYNIGVTYARQGALDEAAVHLSEALRIEPDNLKARINLANVLLALGKTGEAIEQYSEALRITPTSAEAHNNLGYAFSQSGKMDQAVARYSEALRLNPNYTEAHQNLADALVALGKPEEAIVHYRDVLRMTPDSAKVYQKIASVLALLGNTGGAIEHYREALRLSPGWSEVANNLAWILATCEDGHLRNGEEAIRLAEQACQSTHHERAAFLDTLGAAYAEAGRFEDAVEIAQRAVSLAHSAGQEQLVQEIQTRIEWYKAKHPFHENPHRLDTQNH